MNDLQVLNYDSHNIRTIERDGELWWVLKDVCIVLEISDNNSVSRRLDDDEKGVGQIPTPGGTQEMTVINEAGLYNVILRSDKPNAKDFKRWVTHEVLPSIRKNGFYAVAPKSATEMFLLQAQINMEHEQRMNQIEAKQIEQDEKLHGIAAAFTASPTTETEWQEDANRRVNEMVETYSLNHQTFRSSVYERLEHIANVDLTRRQTRMRNRMKAQGRTKTQCQSVTKLYIIAQDQKLRAIFDGILREEKAKHLCA